MKKPISRLRPPSAYPGANAWDALLLCASFLSGLALIDLGWRLLCN